MLDGHECPRCGETDSEPSLYEERNADDDWTGVDGCVKCFTCGFEFVVHAQRHVVVEHSSRCKSDQHVWQEYELWGSTKMRVASCMRCGESRPKE